MMGRWTRRCSPAGWRTPVRSYGSEATCSDPPTNAPRPASGSSSPSTPSASTGHRSPSASRPGASASTSSTETSRCHPSRLGPNRTMRWRRSQRFWPGSTLPRADSTRRASIGATRWPIRWAVPSSATTTSAWRTSSFGRRRPSPSWTSTSPRPVGRSSTWHRWRGCACRSMTTSTPVDSDGWKRTGPLGCDWWRTRTASTWSPGGHSSPPRRRHRARRRVRAAAGAARRARLRRHVGGHGGHGTVRPSSTLVGCPPPSLRPGDQLMASDAVRARPAPSRSRAPRRS